VAVVPVRVVKGDVYRVNRRVYVVLRSFLDSSLRADLPWNIGVKVDADTVEFRKPGRWSLAVSRNLVLLRDVNNYPVLRVEISNEAMSLKFEEYTFTAKLMDLTELLNIYVHNEELEYAAPLSLYAIAHKILYYYRNSLR
jgi:hypothetical protein